LIGEVVEERAAVSSLERYTSCSKKPLVIVRRSPVLSSGEVDAVAHSGPPRRRR